ncbi:MAG: GntR family transcriptional regulator [Anaerolineales bacterium]|jgi:GntR family transcriptional regulator
MDNSQSTIQLIDNKSKIPYYYQLMSIMKEMIRVKTWKPGNQIPGELELCNDYKVSRTVVRQALREMEFEGLIIRRKGKGTFVAEPKISESLVQKLTGFYQDMAERGLKSTTQVLHHQVVPANEMVAGYLHISPGTKVVEIHRLRFVEEAPIQVVTSYIPLELCPQVANVDLTNRSLYEFLEKECHLFIARGRRYIEAVAANEKEAKFLQVDFGAPLIMLDSISYLEDDTPIEYYHAVHRGDRSRFEVELLRVRSQSLANVPDGLGAENLPPSTILIHSANPDKKT